jgi:hypothetical protein
MTAWLLNQALNISIGGLILIGGAAVVFLLAWAAQNALTALVVFGVFGTAWLIGFAAISLFDWELPR